MAGPSENVFPSSTTWPGEFPPASESTFVQVAGHRTWVDVAANDTTAELTTFDVEEG